MRADPNPVDFETRTLTSNISLDLEPCLEVLESATSESVGRLIPMTGDGVTIGRASSAGVQIDDESISREHVKFVLLANGDVDVTDLGSTNGTYVNGSRIEQAALRVGDRVRVGQTLLQYVRDSLRRTLRVNDVLASARIALWDWDARTERFSASPNFAEVTGVMPAEIAQNPRAALSLVHPEDQERASGAVRSIMQNGESLDAEIRLRSSGAVDTWLAVKITLVKTGSSFSLTGSATNITARKRAEREIRRLTLVLENLYDAILITDLSGRITDWTAKAQAAFQKRRGETLPSKLDELLGTKAAAEIQRGISERGHWTGEMPIYISDDGEVVYEVAAAPLKDDGGWAVGYVAAFRDVTAKKALQNQLLMADKLAAIGTIAAGVAHEINNPLAVVTGGIDFLADRVAQLAPSASDGVDAQGVRQILEEMREGVTRIAGIVAGLKTVSSKEESAGGDRCQLGRTIEQAARLLANEARHSAQLTIQIPPQLWVRSNETRLTQVFIHLIANAVHAIADGQSDKNAITIEAEQDGAEHVVISVRDTGVGMSAETLRRLFTPFFTTKAAGKGTGLGLSVSRTIIESFGGSIWFESKLGEGSCARVKLPLASPPKEVPSQAKAAKPVRRGPILVIDDEPFVASAICRLLRSRGFQTETAQDGKVGLEMILTRRFQAVICDLMMPEFSGVDLFHKLTATAPDLVEKIVFLSGGAFTPRAEEFVAEAKRPILGKPWKADALVAALEAIE